MPKVIIRFGIIGFSKSREPYPRRGKQGKQEMYQADMSYIQDVHGFIDKRYGDIILSSGYVARPGITEHDEVIT